MSDWDTVTVLRKKHTSGQAKSSQAVSQARRAGAAVETDKKYGGGGNRQHQASKNSARLDAETEELKHATVSLSVGRAIMQARAAKGLSQKDLGTKINEKPQVVGEYESGKTIPNQQVLGKLERALGIKLRGKNIGQPLAPRGKKKDEGAAAGKKGKGKGKK